MKTLKQLVQEYHSDRYVLTGALATIQRISYRCGMPLEVADVAGRLKQALKQDYETKKSLLTK
jgi:hypothetical protein